MSKCVNADIVTHCVIFINVISKDPKIISVKCTSGYVKYLKCITNYIIIFYYYTGTRNLQITIFHKTHTHTHTPVSYTHLDVYKRQGMRIVNAGCLLAGCKLQ